MIRANPFRTHYGLSKHRSRFGAARKCGYRHGRGAFGALAFGDAASETGLDEVAEEQGEDTSGQANAAKAASNQAAAETAQQTRSMTFWLIVGALGLGIAANFASMARS